MLKIISIIILLCSTITTAISAVLVKKRYNEVAKKLQSQQAENNSAIEKITEEMIKMAVYAYKFDNDAQTAMRLRKYKRNWNQRIMRKRLMKAKLKSSPQSIKLNPDCIFIVKESKMEE